MKIDFSTENLTPVQKKLLLIVPPLIIVGLAVVFIVMPSLEKIDALSAEVQKQNNDIRIAQQTAGKLSTLVAENERLKARLSELRLQLPEEKEVSGLLKQVSELGVTSGLQVMLWKPKDKVVHSSKEIYEIPVDVEMRGDYHRFGQFFSNITGLNRIVNIANISIKGQKVQRGLEILQVNFNAMTYSMIPETELKELGQKEKKKKK